MCPFCILIKREIKPSVQGSPNAPLLYWLLRLLILNILDGLTIWVLKGNPGFSHVPGGPWSRVMIQFIPSEGCYLWLLDVNAQNGSSFLSLCSRITEIQLTDFLGSRSSLASQCFLNLLSHLLDFIRSLFRFVNMGVNIIRE